MVTFGPPKQFYRRAFTTPSQITAGELFRQVPILCELCEALYGLTIWNDNEWKCNYEGLVYLDTNGAYEFVVARRSMDGGNSWVLQFQLMEEELQREMYGPENQTEWLGLIQLGEFKEESDAIFVSEMIDQVAAAVLSLGGELTLWPKDWNDHDIDKESPGTG